MTELAQDEQGWEKERHCGPIHLGRRTLRLAQGRLSEGTGPYVGGIGTRPYVHGK